MAKKIPNDVPKVGEFYHFWDDGKTALGRHYIAKVEEIIPLKDAASYLIENKEFGQSRFDKDKYSLLECWVDEKTHRDWLLSDKTDYIVRCSIPKYDDDPIFFVRDKYNKWFSIETTGWWQGGRLDLDGSIFQEIMDADYYSDETKELYKAETYEK